MGKKNASNPLTALGLAGISLLGGLYLARRAYGWLISGLTYPLISDKYDKNMWELVNATLRSTPGKLIETELRAGAEEYIKRPIGGPHRFKYAEQIMFNMAQLAKLPTPYDQKIDLGVTIGPRAARPLKIKMPLLAGGMAYGLGLSETFKLAIAKGATLAGTATNTGQGPWLEAERKLAKHLILQYSRTSWNKDPKIIKQAEAIEIQFGQGASAGAAQILKSKHIGAGLRQRMGLKAGQDAIVHSRLTGAASPRELQELVKHLRQLTGGVPIGVKIGAGLDLEQDLAIAAGAGADFISLDGAEGGSHSALPILQDDFGLPTIIAVSRAARFWQDHSLKGKVTLLAGGGLISAGDCLKVLALGADAVYMGTAVVFATTHNQVLKVIPYEPPTQLVWENGKYKDKFDLEEGARSLANFFNAMAHELEEAVKALGKTSLSQVSTGDMCALNREVSEITGLKLCYLP
jgi:glutamate synthase domain-containing protein 2